TSDGVIISDNFAAMHRVGVGDVIPLPSDEGMVHFTVIGTMADYSWNHGTLFVHRKDYLRHWHDRQVDAFDIYLEHDPGAWAAAAGLCRTFGFTADDTGRFVAAAKEQRKRRVQEAILKTHTEKGLYALTREDLQ